MGRHLELLCLYFFACEQRYMRSATPTLSPLYYCEEVSPAQSMAPSGPSPALACLGLVRGGSADQREAALASLAAMLSSEDASDEAIVQVNELICSTAG